MTENSPNHCDKCRCRDIDIDKAVAATVRLLATLQPMTENGESVQLLLNHQDS